MRSNRPESQPVLRNSSIRGQLEVPIKFEKNHFYSTARALAYPDGAARTGSVSTGGFQLV